MVPGGAEVMLVHVLSPPEFPNPLIAHYESHRRTRAECRRLAAEARRNLEALIPAAADARGVSGAAEVIEDRDPARALDAAARRFGAELICIGAPAYGPLASALLGSTARRMLGYHGPPVLMVRPESDPELGVPRPQ
jgi:nucleotide-binding universal stress UspA family protein